jgi:MraZ protein
MFLGEFRHSVDTKGRVILPAKFRDALKDGVVVTRGLENCLWIFSKTGWVQIEDGIRKLSLTKNNARKFARLLLSGASEEQLDRQGRISLPPQLREHAGLNRDIVIIGVSDRIEVWSRENWEKYSKEAEESFADVAEELTEFGI